jgi:cytochrome c-type biogenesis protein CcmF
VPYAYPGFFWIILGVCLWFYIKNHDHLKSENQLESLVSRESSFMFNNLLLLGATFAVLCGTLFPILSEKVRGYKITVGAPFFNKVMIPIGLLLLFLTGVGPLLAWRSTSVGSIKRNFTWPAVFSVVVGAALIALNPSQLSLPPWIGFAHLGPWLKSWFGALELAKFYSWLAFVIGALVFATIASEFFRGGRVLQGKLNTNIVLAMYQLMRRNMRRYGGYVVHFGIVVLFIGVAGLAFNVDQEQEMGRGEKMTVGHYTLVGADYTQDDNANYISEAALVDVYKNGRFLVTLNPELRFFKANGGQPDHKAAIHSTMLEDLYVIYEGKNQDNGHPIIKAAVNPLVSWVWIGVLIVAFGTGLALVPNAAPITAHVPKAVTVGAMEGLDKQGMQPAGVGK